MLSCCYCPWTFRDIFWCSCSSEIWFIHSQPRAHAYRYVSVVMTFTLSPPFHVALPFPAPPRALVGDEQSPGVLSDPRFDQACAAALGSGPGGRRPLARPPTGAARHSQWPRDSLCRHATTGLWTLSGKIVLLTGRNTFEFLENNCWNVTFFQVKLICLHPVAETDSQPYSSICN